MLQILHLNALNPLGFVSLEKDISCASLYGFLVLVTWRTKIIIIMAMTTESKGNLQKKKHDQELNPAQDMTVRSHS